MNYAIFVFLLVFSFSNCSSKLNYSEDEPILYLYVDKLPQFNFGNGLDNYIYINMKWPSQFDGEGTVIVSFVVQNNGIVSEVKIERGLCPPCDEEVRRLFESMPNWEPGLKGLKTVNVKLYMPIVFKISK